MLRNTLYGFLKHVREDLRKRRAPQENCQGPGHAVVFVGSTLRPEDIPDFPAASFAGSRYQYALAAACARIGTDGISVLTVTPVQMWRPGSNSPKVSRHISGRWARESLTVDRPAFVNILGLKQATVAIGLFRSLHAWARTNRSSHLRSVIVYNSSYYEVIPAKIMCLMTNSQLVIILADVPAWGNPAFQGLFRRAHDSLGWRMLRYCDVLVALTKRAAEDLSGSARSIVLEAGVERASPASDCSPAIARPKRIVYAGDLGYYSGVHILIEAVEGVSAQDVELHIYGAGSYVPEILEAAARTPGRIQYHGKVSHDEVARAEVESDLLVCPRIPDGSFTLYTFPSKIYEYMSTGVPTMCNHLEGLPDEILPFLNRPREPSPAAWTQGIEDFFEQENAENWRRATSGREYLQQHKTWDQQAARLLKFLERGENEERAGCGTRGKDSLGARGD